MAKSVSNTIYPRVLLGFSTLLPATVLAVETDLEVYGFAQVDYVQGFDRVTDEWSDTLRPGRIPTGALSSKGSDGQAVISARQSRLGVQGTVPVEGGGELFTKFEFDMFGVGPDEGQTTIRLRHAYGEWNGLLAGQTNTLFMDGDVFPNVIDYWGPSGMVFLRSPQIRWTPVRSETSSFAVAIENNPGNDVQGADGVTPNVAGDEELPDVTAQYRMMGDWGHLQVAGILRQVGYDTPTQANGEPEDEEFGWGVNLTSSFNFGSDKLMLGVVHGEGVASYMNDGGNDAAIGGAAPDYELLPLTGVVAYYDHYWSERYSTSFGYSATMIDNTDFQAGNAFEKGEYASANLLYTPAKPILMGVEGLYGKRTDNDGTTGFDRRIQFSVKYSFSSKGF